MALSAQQIKTLQNTLTKTFKTQATVVFDNNKTFKILVNTRDQNFRIGLLKVVQKTFAAAPYNATYSPVSGKSGEVKINKNEFLIVAKEAKTAGKPMFKPSDIVPSIVNSWLDPASMIANVKKYIQSVDLSSQERNSIIQLIDLTAQGTTVKYTLPNFSRDLVPSEFFDASMGGARFGTG